MKYEQKRRLSKIDVEPIYLVDSYFNENNGIYDFGVSGATANLYTVVFIPGTNTLTKMINCNCGDGTGVAKVLKVKCKHACFVWIRILELPDEYLEFERFSRDELEYLRKKVTKVKRINKLNSFYRNKDQENEYHQHLLRMNKIFIPGETKRNDETCPICMSVLKLRHIVGCPDCNNLIHQDCAQAWLRSGRKTCIYCRSDKWEDYNFILPPTKNKTSKYESSTYANLGKYKNYNSLGSESSTE